MQGSLTPAGWIYACETEPYSHFVRRLLDQPAAVAPMLEQQILDASLHKQWEHAMLVQDNCLVENLPVSRLTRPTGGSLCHLALVRLSYRLASHFAISSGHAFSHGCPSTLRLTVPLELPSDPGAVGASCHSSFTPLLARYSYALS